MKTLVAILIFSNTFSWAGVRSEWTDVGTLLPENDRRIQVRSAEANNLTEEQYNQILQAFRNLYGPLFAEKELEFDLVGSWQSATVNAYADRAGRTARVTIFGGIARHKAITPDGLAAVICHEIGHHLGGAPKVRGWGSNPWASNDGQSDYFATLKCLRRYFKTFSTAQNVAIVNRLFQRRSFMADPSVVNVTSDRHPPAQCRLDTFFRGALCPIPEIEDVHNQNPYIGTCSAVNGAPELYHRPRCWFKPAETFARR
ncbi:MAG: M48 family metalloprotease [Bdellovibrionales bacterium]